MHFLSRDPRLLLATDLDGTFLAGDIASREQLYHLISVHSNLQVAWITGRSREDTKDLLADPTLPPPTYLICDVGATVFGVSDMQPIEPLQSQIDASWPGESVVDQALKRFSSLTRQKESQERRCSYYCSPEQFRAIRGDFECAVNMLGCEFLYSADRYLDVLPKNTCKGSTLSALVNMLGIAPKRVLVAGNTLNDLSMYNRGYPGVCVGASEQALLEETASMHLVLHANAPGCGGILEAIEHFNWFNWNFDFAHE